MEQNIVRFNYGVDSTIANRVGVNNLNYTPKCTAIGYTSLVATVSAQLQTNRVRMTHGLDIVDYVIADAFPRTVEEVMAILAIGVTQFVPAIDVTFTKVAAFAYTVAHSQGPHTFSIDFIFGDQELTNEIFSGGASIIIEGPVSVSDPLFPNPSLGVRDIMMRVTPKNLLVVPVLGYGESVLHFFDHREVIDLGQFCTTLTMSVYIPYLDAIFVIDGNKTSTNLVVSS